VVSTPRAGTPTSKLQRPQKLKYMNILTPALFSTTTVSFTRAPTFTMWTVSIWIMVC
jgi:hypothetical protein